MKILAALLLVFLTGIPLLSMQNEQGASDSRESQQSKEVVAAIPFEIKGDRIGESVAQFTAHYPAAKCESQSPEVRECTHGQHGITLAGLPTLGDTCNSPSTEYWRSVCPMLGLDAKFEKDKLVSLRYTFYGTVGYEGPKPDTRFATDDYIEESCKAFAAKYGKPDSQLRTGCLWWRNLAGGEAQQTLQVFIMPVPRAVTKGTNRDTAFIVVTLDDHKPSNDI